MNKNAFTLIEVLVVVVLITGLGTTAFFLLNTKETPQVAIQQESINKSPIPTTSPTASATPLLESTTEPPVLAKNIGFKFEAFDPKTNRAGDFVFGDIPALKDKANGNSLWQDYGIPDNRGGNLDKNVQTNFLLPVGTKITSMIDGEVVGITPLYSNDVGIMIAKNKASKWRYEHEHVINPKVKVGDIVKAGDVIAEVGPRANTWEYGKYGLFEIGLYRPHPNGVGGSEDCIFKFLDPSVKQEIHANVTSMYKAWEAFRGDASIYDQENYYSPGCAIGDTITWEKVGM